MLVALLVSVNTEDSHDSSWWRDRGVEVHSDTFIEAKLERK